LLFNIEYVFQKGGPKYSAKYPNKKDEENNIFIIRGKNDKGKSSILEMVSLGFYGHYSQDIDKFIIDRMKRFMSNSVDEFHCSFMVKDKNEKHTIDVKITKREIETKIDNKYKPRDFILKNYKVLFDVPEDPLKKLSYALKDMVDNFRQYEIYANNYREYVKKQMDQLEDYNNKQKRIDEENEELNEKQEILKNILNRYYEVEANLRELERAKVVVTYEDKLKEFNLKDKHYTNVKKEITNLKSKGARGGNTKYRKLVEEFAEITRELRFAVGTSTYLERFIPKPYKKDLEKYKSQISKSITIKSLSSSDLKNWYSFFKKIKKEIESNPKLNIKFPEEDEIKLITKILPILKEFIDTATVIPGTDGKTVSEFIRDLEKSKRKAENKISEKITLNNALKNCSEIIDLIQDLTSKYSRLPENDSAIEEDYNNLMKEKNELESELSKIATELGKLEEEYEKIPEEEKLKLRMLKDQVKNDYENTKREYSTLRKKKEDLAKEITIKRKVLENLKQLQKPYGELDTRELRELYDKVSSILRKISTWKDYINSFNLNNMTIEKQVDEDALKFYDILGNYFAELLKVVYFENRSWELYKVDLINRRYVVKGRKSIDFIDIGRGHTALNALMARIKQDYGRRTKILLIDEIGDMDKENLGKLLDEIKIQVKQGKVLLALLTMRDDSTNEVIMDPIPVD